MSTIKQSIYRIWRRVSGGDIPQSTPYTYRELRGYVISGIALAMKNSYWEQRNLEDFKYGDDSISASYSASVLSDPVKGLQYVNLTGETISVAGNRLLDINSLNPMSGLAIDYIPVRREELFIIKKQPKTPCMIYFYKEDGKAYFFGKKVNEASVLVTEKYAIPADDDADLKLPVELENQAFEMAYRLLVPLAPADRANDGVSNN